jgi:hypothetical protein
MPAVVVKSGNRWLVLSHAGGRKLGSHASKAKAKAQARAVNASLKRQGKI